MERTPLWDLRWDLNVLFAALPPQPCERTYLLYMTATYQKAYRTERSSRTKLWTWNDFTHTTGKYICQLRYEIKTQLVCGSTTLHPELLHNSHTFHPSIESTPGLWQQKKWIYIQWLKICGHLNTRMWSHHGYINTPCILGIMII